MAFTSYTDTVSFENAEIGDPPKNNATNTVISVCACVCVCVCMGGEGREGWEEDLFWAFPATSF